MDSRQNKRFESALYAVNEKTARVLRAVSLELKEEIQEIRLRTNKFLSVTIKGQSFFVCKNSEISVVPNENCVLLSQNDVEESFKLLIRGSVYSHLSEIKEGYIMMRYGHRAGICGSFTKTGNMSHISSINIRISKQVFGCADEIFKGYTNGGLLIAGPPGSGKTTVLRDFIRQMSMGTKFPAKRVCVVDTRGEISASYLGESFNDLGQNTDILVGYEKHKGFLMAVRTMFPDIVAFDEFGTKEELDNISEGFLSGVNVALTAHINNEYDLVERKITNSLLKSGAINTVAVLYGSPFKKMSVLTVGQVLKQCGQ